MRRSLNSRLLAGAGAFSLFVGLYGCSGGSDTLLIGRSLFSDFVGTGSGGGSGGGGGGGGVGGVTDCTPRGDIDPCSEPTGRKFVTISMQNLDTDDFVHYFFIAVAFQRDDTADPTVDPLHAFGGVCPTDSALYTQNGYTFFDSTSGDAATIGGYSFPTPVYIYFHLGGDFENAGGSLASAIAPANSGQPTFDATFTSNGFDIPVPDLILFHNPGTGDGAALRVSTLTGIPCQRDAFYYVDDQDRRVGSNAIGTGSSRRVPNEIQGTGCRVNGSNADPFQRLAPSCTDTNTRLLDEFARGGRIEYAFRRVDESPPIPQLVWRVTDDQGGQWQDFDQGP